MRSILPFSLLSKSYKLLRVQALTALQSHIPNNSLYLAIMSLENDVYSITNVGTNTSVTAPAAVGAPLGGSTYNKSFAQHVSLLNSSVLIEAFSPSNVHSGTLPTGRTTPTSSNQSILLSMHSPALRACWASLSMPVMRP